MRGVCAITNKSTICAASMGFPACARFKLPADGRDTREKGDYTILIALGIDTDGRKHMGHGPDGGR